MRTLRHLAATLLLALAACGGENGGDGELPTDPVKAARYVLMAQDVDFPEYERRLELWPHDLRYFDGDAKAITHEIISRRLQRRLNRSELAPAKADFDYLREHHDGWMKHVSGPLVVREGFATRAIRLAREWMEGGSPRLDDAAEAAELAEQVLLPSDDMRAEVEVLRTWVDLREAAQIGVPLDAHEGPRVIVIADDFMLGEVILPQVLMRWARDLVDAGLRVEVHPMEQGSVRVGMRRVPATADEEMASVRGRFASSQVQVAAFVPRERWLGTRFGTNRLAGGIFVADRGGQIVARMTGMILDPRELNDVVQRVATR